MTPVMVMHPYRSDLEGKNVSDYVDPNNKHLFIEFRNKVKSDGAGFVAYMWQWKDNPDHIVPKLSYVIGFEPWGWIIGTGIYIEDVRITIESITKKLRNILIVILLIIIFISIYIVWQGIKTDLALEAANEELLKNTRLATLGLITGKVGHDLRNPLSTIEISINLIEQKISDKDASLRNVIQRIKRGISRCNNIINELLEYIRIGNLELEKTDIDNWLNSLVKDYQFMEDIHVNLNLNSHVTLNIDKERFYRCIVNILSNSIESMEENIAIGIDKKLIISSNVKDNNLIISFEDNGNGIPDDIKDKIFEPLFTTKAKGIGLGMTVIKQIMQQQGGEIEISSETGKGTIVTLILPIDN